MYQNLWVASDGITTVRFPDQNSAEIYCAETGYPVSDLFIVRQQVTVSDDGEITVEPWQISMHPDVGEDDLGITPSMSSEEVAKIGVLSYRTGWPFRDLAASIEEIIDEVANYVATCDSEGKNPTMDEAMQVAFRGTITARLSKF